MSAKKAKLNLEFGPGGVRMNYAMANDVQPRHGEERDWTIGTLSFNTEEFECFPGVSQNRIDESRIQAIVGSISKIIGEWQKETGHDFDSPMEVTLSSAFFDVLFFPYSIEFSELKEITADDIKKIEECKKSEKMFQIPIPDEKIKSLTSPYFTISNEKDIVSRILDPIGRKTKNLGFNAYFITKHPMLSRLMEVMKEDGDKINVFLSCEKEFKALANDRERNGKTALIHITDSASEFSIWEKSELKYLNRKDSGFKDLKEAIWRLCLCYYRKPELIEKDFELAQEMEYMRKFHTMVKNADISDEAKELLSADDCSYLLEIASCILENETEESIKYSRLELPGKNKSKTGLTISNYVLCYFTREAIRSLLMEIKQSIDGDDFCKPENIILECPLPLEGLERLAREVFGLNARRAIVKWDGEIRNDISSSAIGSLQSLIAGEEPENIADPKKKTSKFPNFFGNFFSRAS